MKREPLVNQKSVYDNEIVYKTDKKKILFVANVAKEHINKFHIPSILAFKNRGWDVDVICSLDEKIPHCNKTINGVWERSPFTFKTLKGVFQLKKIIDEGNYDVVYSHTPVGGFVARLSKIICSNHNTKVIYFAHGLHFFKGCPKANWLLYPIEKILSYFTDAMFVINEEDYNIVNKCFNQKLDLCLLPGIGIDFNRLKIEDRGLARKEVRKMYGIKEDDIVLIYIAELLQNKNQGYLLEVLRQLSAKSDKFKLMLVGPDHCNGFYLNKAKELEIENRVIFTGWRDDIGRMLSASDICVASSIREGFGINIIEAMYYQLPVVAVRNRGHLSIIKDGENGFLVSLDNSEEMTNRIMQIVEDDELRQSLSKHDVSMYSANKIANEIVTIVDKLIRI